VEETSTAPNERFIGFPQSPQDVVLGYPNFSGSVVINLSNAEIKAAHPPQFRFGTVLLEYTGVPHYDEVTLALVIGISVDDIALRGARGLRIGTLRHPMPDGIINSIEMDAPDGFINTEITKGTFSIEVETPPYVPGSNQTYGEGLYLEVALAISQAPMNVNGEVFSGLTGPWRVGTETDMDFGEHPQTINGNDINIDSGNSFLYITAGQSGISFELFGEHFDEKKLPVTVRMDMNIEQLGVIRWELDDELIPIPEIELDFADIGGTDVTEFLESITFDQIELGLNFTALDQALDGGIALLVKSPRLGFPGSATDAVVLTKGENIFSSTASETAPLEINLVDNSVIAVEVEILPVRNGVPMPNSRILELGPFDIDGERETELTISAEINLNFNWTEAYINLTRLLGDGYSLSGGVPDEPVEFGALLSDFMSGVTFSDGAVGLGVYLDGPTGLINEIQPSFRLTAVFGDDEEPDQLLNLGPDDIRFDGFPTLPDNGIFTGTSLPPGGLDIELDGFLNIIADMPEYLGFTYEVELGQGGIIRVTPDMFEDVLDYDGAIRAMVLLKIALDFHAGPGAYFALPLFENEPDLFGRANRDDPLFNDNNLNINSLRLRVEFNDSVFRGARLHVDGGRFDTGIPDADILFGRNGLSLADQHGNLDITFTSRDMDVINRRLIPPDIRIVYPNPGGTRLRIPRDPLPTRISIAASGSYRLTFDD